MCNPTTMTSEAKETVATGPPNDKEEEDPRLSVSDLLKKHDKTIAKVREEIQKDPLYKGQEERYDDIWILRFVLSHKKSKPATVAALKTMKFRAEKKLNELGDVRHRIYNHQYKGTEDEEGFPVHKTFFSYCHVDGVMHTHPDPDRGVVTYILADHIELTKVAQEMSEEDLADVYMLADECIFQIMDEVTRRTGRLTKVMRIMDMTDIGLLTLDTNYVKKDGAAAKANEDYYPQLLGNLLVVNAPSWLYNTWKVLSVFFPKRVVEKLDFADPKKHPKDLKRFQRYISTENLPDRYGGKNPVWPPPFAGKRFREQRQSTASPN